MFFLLAAAVAAQVLDVEIISPTRLTAAPPSNWLVDFSVTLSNSSQSWPSLALGFPRVNSPVNATYQAGASTIAPGLVVLCNTTESILGSSYSGPTTNLAGLMELNAVTGASGTRITAASFAFLAGSMFGSGNSELIVYVMNSAAPNVIIGGVPANTTGLLSNIASTSFSLADTTPIPAASASPPTISIKSPKDRVGLDGTNWLVDLIISDTQNSGLLSSYGSSYQDASNTTFGPGANAAAPGLVVLCPTTFFNGPTTNLAGLFQIVATSQISGFTTVNAIWQVGMPVCGTGNSNITVYLTNGTAPDMVDQTTVAATQAITTYFSLSGDTTPGRTVVAGTNMTVSTNSTTPASSSRGVSSMTSSSPRASGSSTVGTGGVNTGNSGGTSGVSSGTGTVTPDTSGVANAGGTTTTAAGASSAGFRVTSWSYALLACLFV